MNKSSTQNITDLDSYDSLILPITIENIVENTVEDIGDSIFFQCPHCNGSIEVEKTQLNCCIFRHGIYKKNGCPIPPHASKEECDSLVKQDLIYGCAGPYKLVKSIKDSSNYSLITVIICDYI